MLQKRILVIEEHNEFFTIIKELFNDKVLYELITCDTNIKHVKEAMKDIPDIIVMNCDNHIQVYKEIVGDKPVFMIPVIVVDSKFKNIDILKSISAGINSYIVKPVEKNYLFYTIKNYINLIYSNRTVSSLTGLPGNIQIANELQRRTLKRMGFYVLYIDLDNFKAYNDTYGFLRGDEVIKLAADIIVDSVSEFGDEGDFVGHIRRRRLCSNY